MQPMHIYAEKEDSFINGEIVVHTYIHTCIPEWIYNKIDASCLKDYVSLEDKTSNKVKEKVTYLSISSCHLFISIYPHDR
jgi:hypothetical protein